MSDALETRLAKMEEAIAELPTLRERVKSLETELEAAKKQLDAYATNKPQPPPPPPDDKALSRRSQRAASVSAVEARARRSSVGIAGSKGWGIAELLGFPSSSTAQVQTPALQGASNAVVGGRRPSVSASQPQPGRAAVPAQPSPTDALEVLRKATAALERHFGQARRQITATAATSVS